MTDHEQAAAVLCLMADYGFPPDFGEVLLQGNPNRGIKPGVLFAIIAMITAALKENGE